MLIFHAHSEVAAYVDQLNQLLVKAGHAKLSYIVPAPHIAIPALM